MKDFDATQKTRHQERELEFGDKPFSFRGETFHVKANVRYGVIKSVAGIAEADDGNKVFSVIEDAVISLISDKDNAAERLRIACANDDFPVTFEDLIELLNWLIEEQTGRPPTPVDSSSNGSGESGTLLMETSSEGPVAV